MNTPWIYVLLIGIEALVLLDYFSPPLTEEMRQKAPVKWVLFVGVAILAGFLYFSYLIDILWDVAHFVPNFKALTSDTIYDDVWFYVGGVGLVIALPAAVYVYLRIKEDKNI